MGLAVMDVGLLNQVDVGRQRHRRVPAGQLWGDSRPEPARIFGNLGDALA
jgi:hypothetical protein